MDLYAACMETLYSFSTYASMKYDQDTANADNQALTLRAQSAEVRIAGRLSFIEPEILTLSEDRLEEYYRQVPDLLRYRVSIKEVIRTRDHALSTEMERLLASAGEMAAVPYNSFSALINADLKFPSVTGPEGQTVTISNGRFVPLMMSPDRALRKEVFEKFYNSAIPGLPFMTARSNSRSSTPGPENTPPPLRPRSTETMWILLSAIT